MQSLLYNPFRLYLSNGTVDLDNDTFKIILLDNAYVPDLESATYAEIAANELPDGNGYTAGGQTLANVTLTRAGNKVTFDADDPVWPGSTFDARYAAIYDATTVDQVLMGYLDFGEVKNVSNGVFTVHFHVDGIFELG